MSSDLFAIDVVIDSVRIDNTKEIVPIPAVAFRFLGYPMQAIHCVPPEKIPILQMADESVLLTTLQSDANLYSFRKGKSCLFTGTFDLLNNAFISSSRLLYLVLLDFYGQAVPCVKAMASLDLLPLFNELENKTKRFSFKRPCCVEKKAIVLPFYAKSDLKVCAEIKFDFAFYYLGPRSDVGESLQQSFSSFNVDHSLSLSKSASTMWNEKKKSVSKISDPTILSAKKQEAKDNLTFEIRRDLTKDDEDDSDGQLDEVFAPGNIDNTDSDRFIVHEPMRFVSSPLFDNITLLGDRNRERDFVDRRRVEFEEEFPLEDDERDRVSPCAGFRRQKDKNIQTVASPLSKLKKGKKGKKSVRPRYDEARRLDWCRHGKTCTKANCRFLTSQDQYPRLMPNEVERQILNRCHTNRYCEVAEPPRRIRGSWKRQIPLANVRRGVTPTPPPEPYWYLGKSRPKYIVEKGSLEFHRFQLLF